MIGGVVELRRAREINAADAVAYEYVARVLADAKSYNLVKIGFTEGD